MILNLLNAGFKKSPFCLFMKGLPRVNSLI